MYEELWRQPGMLELKEYFDQCKLEREMRQDNRRVLKWKKAPPVPGKLFDAGGAQIGPRLYVICGYTDKSGVSDKVFVFDMKRRRWEKPITIPEGMAHSHLGVSVEAERYIYVVSGQRGPQCYPAVCDSFILDTKTSQWSKLPPLPQPRYAPIAEITGGRLHVAGGSGKDRVTPAADHWSIAVERGQAIETEWRKEPPIPHGGPHRGSIVIDEDIYVFGGQEGDFRAIEGDAEFKCTRNTIEMYHPECYRYRAAQKKWERLADMPVTASHTDYSLARWGDQILISGGQVDKSKDDFLLTLTDCVQAYNIKTNTWSDFGRLPYRVKTVVSGIWEDTLFVMSGQRDKCVSNPKPGKVVNYSWELNLNDIKEKSS